MAVHAGHPYTGATTTLRSKSAADCVVRFIVFHASEYLSTKRLPNTLLVSNFLTPPVIEQVDTSGYHRRSDGMIRITATDSIAVAAVTVVIRGADGIRIEAGDAECDHGV